jgi:adenylyltransferase/sulfurtransferase
MASSFKDGRYARQVLLPFLTGKGQEKLLNSRVTLMGCGALGTGIANNLARAGVGHLRICDRDFVELNNLHRQMLFDETDVAEQMPKAEAAVRRLRQVNSEIELEPVVADINFTNIERLIEDADVVIDGTDNFQTRYLVNDACVKAAKPWIYGACVSSYGLVMPIIPGKTACLRCAFPERPEAMLSPTCDTAGVLNASSLAVACLQSAEAIKLLVGAEEALIQGMLQVDVWTNTYQGLKVKRTEGCVTCGQRKFEFLEGDQELLLSSLCGREAVQIVQRNPSRVDLASVAETLSKIGTVTVTRFLLKAIIDNYEITVFPDGRALVKGTTDFTVAKNVYSKYIGS